MANVQSIDLTLGVEGAASAAASAGSVGNALVAAGGALHRLAEAFPDFLHTEVGNGLCELRLECVDLIFAETVDFSALGAGKVILQPSDRYLELAAAVAGEVDLTLDLDLHGWPILSSLSASTTIAEAGGASSASGGGQEA